MVADWYKNVIHCDCALVNSGNFRSDTVLKKGPITYGMVTDFMIDVIVTKKVKGSKLYEAL
jgi:hypothetical protein